MIWHLDDLIEHCRTVAACIDGQYVPARPMRLMARRWRAAWLVLTDRADAVIWPGGQ